MVDNLFSQWISHGSWLLVRTCIRVGQVKGVLGKSVARQHGGRDTEFGMVFRQGELSWDGGHEKKNDSDTLLRKSMSIKLAGRNAFVF